MHLMPQDKSIENTGYRHVFDYFAHEKVRFRDNLNIKRFKLCCFTCFYCCFVKLCNCFTLDHFAFDIAIFKSLVYPRVLLESVFNLLNFMMKSILAVYAEFGIRR